MSRVLSKSERNLALRELQQSTTHNGRTDAERLAMIAKITAASPLRSLPSAELFASLAPPARDDIEARLTDDIEAAFADAKANATPQELAELEAALNATKSAATAPTLAPTTYGRWKPSAKTVAWLKKRRELRTATRIKDMRPGCYL